MTGLDLGIASVGVGQRSNGGLGADVEVNLGGIANGDVNATIGGQDTLARVDANANALNDEVTLNSKTSLFGENGVFNTENKGSLLGTPAEADINIGGGRGMLGLIDPDVCIGRSCGGPADPGPGDPNDPRDPRDPRDPISPRDPSNPRGPNNLTDIINDMSPTELARNKKLCRNILAQPNSYDRDLVGLCRMLQLASR